ncbi:hypothetical protein KR009_002325, partial [Drosophila setifemur]
QVGRSAAPPGGGGRQWLHSNQATTQNYVQGSGQGFGQGSFPQASPADPFAGYNQSMRNQYTDFKPTYGHSQLGLGMSYGMGNEMGGGMPGGMGGGMSGMDGGMGGGMGRMGGGMDGGMSSMGYQRIAGGRNHRSNG